jgi:radical SAM superfamily enzyme YgiQ (UPF0313 family)
MGCVQTILTRSCWRYGIESATPQILKAIKKHESLDVIRKAIGLARMQGISCQGFFILGLPGETHKTIEEDVEFAKSSGLSRAHFMILDILPGSELWETMEGRFVPDWKKKSFREPEYLPEGLTKKELLRWQSKALRSFYSRPGPFVELIRLVDLRQSQYLLKRLRDYRIIKRI